MAIPEQIIYPRSDHETVYLKSVVTDPSIIVGDYTYYHDFTGDPTQFQTKNVLYHYPINHERLIIGKYCSIASGARFLFTSANHAKQSLCNFPFPIFANHWGLDWADVSQAWDNKGDTVIGNDVWIGYEAVIMQGVQIGDGAVIGTRAVVTKNVAPYSIVGGVPAREIGKRFPPDVIEQLLALRWWDWPNETVQANLPLLMHGYMDQLSASAR